MKENSKTPTRWLLENISHRVGLLFAQFLLIVSIMLTGQIATADPIGVTNEGFENPLTLSEAKAPDAWYPDRYRPAAFEAFDFLGSNVLRLAIDGVADGAAQRGSQGSTFYNTHGRKLDLPARSFSAAADMYFPESWNGDVRRRSDIWATAVNAESGISYYPIIGIANNDGTPVIRYWGSDVGWVNTTIVPVANTWYRFEIRISGSNLEYLIDNVVVATLPGNNSVEFTDVMLQAYNYNDSDLGLLQSDDSYEVYWDNLTYSYPVIVNVTQAKVHFTLSEAITEAVAGDIIELPSGNYSGAYTIDKEITLRGSKHGVHAGPTPGDRGTNESVIDGGFIVSAANVVIDGLTIQNGRAYGGANVGVAVAASGVTVTNTIIENVASPSQSDGLTTAMGTNNLTLTNSTIRNNWRGIYLNPGSGHILTNNLIDANNGVGVGIGSDGQSNLALSGNAISNHTLEGWGASAVGSGVVASGNSFSSNGTSVAHYGGSAIDANYNYWGGLTGPGNGVSGNVLASIYYTDDERTVLFKPVRNSTSGATYLSIQSAINEANSGDILELSPGTYGENVVTTVPLTIQGSDPGVVISPASGVGVSLASGNGTERSILRNVSVIGGGSGTGIKVKSSTTLEGVSSIGWNYGISLDAGSDLAISGCHFDGNNVGLKIPSTVEYTDIVVNHSSFDNNNKVGWYSGDAGSNAAPRLDNVEITNSSFSGNNEKGIYTERLSNALFDNVSVNNNGLATPGNVSGAGIMIALTHRNDYSSIVIQNSSFTGNAIGNARGSALTIKALSPAILDDVTVLNTVFQNNERHYVLGEVDKPDSGAANVTISNSKFLGDSPSGAVVNYASDNIDANSNYWGNASGPGTAVVGNVSAIAYYTDEARENLSWMVKNETSGAYYSTIQAAISAATAGDTIKLNAGTFPYVSAVVIRKSITLIGAGSGETIIDLKPQGTAYGFDIVASDVTLEGFTILPPTPAPPARGGYAIHAQYDSSDDVPYENLTLRDILVAGGDRTPFVVHGYNNVILEGLTAINTKSGNGIQVSGCEGVTITDCTTSGNAWGDVAFYVSTFLDRGTSDVSFDFSSNDIGGQTVYFQNSGGLVNNVDFLNHNYSITNGGVSLYTNGDAAAAIALATAQNSASSNTASVITDAGGSAMIFPGLSLQAAINSAQEGDVLDVAPGIYEENLSITTPITLKGTAEGVVIQSSSGAAITMANGSANSRIVLQNITVQGIAASNVGVSAGSFTTLRNVISTGHAYGVRLVEADNSVTSIEITGGSFSGNNVGLHIPTTVTVSEITVTDTIFEDNMVGWNAEASKDAKPNLSELKITGAVFRNNSTKGFYTERLSNAVLENLTVSGNGSGNTETPGTGLELNLKWLDFDNVIIRNSFFQGNGVANDPVFYANQGALAIKARNDGSYAEFPATLSNLTVSNNVFDGNGISFSLGEPAKDNPPIAGLMIEKNKFLSSDTVALQNDTDGPIDARNNYWGPTGPSVGDIGGEASGVPYYTAYDASNWPDDVGLSQIDGPVLNATKTSYHASIQEAINEADPSDVIEVAPGIYAEDIVVDRAVKLRGPNAGINPNTGVRGLEAVLRPGSSFGSTGLVVVTASDVEIDGFTLEGDNPDLVSEVLGTNGADFDTFCAVYQVTDNVGNLVVKNNSMKNFLYFGVHLYGASTSAPATSGNLISQNLMEDFGSYQEDYAYAKWGGGVLLHNNQYTRVVDNVMKNVRLGVQTGNFARANPGSTDYQVISGNDIQTRRLGVFYNMHYSSASAYTISDNNVTGMSNSNEVGVTGILLSSQSVGSFSEGNNIDMSEVTGLSNGYEVWNVKGSSVTQIQGGTVTGAGIGLFVNNYEGYNSNAPDGAHASVGDLAITPRPGGIGIRVLDSSNSTTHAAVGLAISSGVSVTGGATGLVVENANASITSVSGLSLSGQTENYIELIANGDDINATTVSFAGKTGAQMTTGELLAVENKMVHEPDSAGLGYVSILPSFDVTNIVIDDAQTADDFHIPAGSNVTITPTGSLAVSGQFTLAEGSTLNVIGGDLTFPDGTVFSGDFTFFNSFGSIHFNDDVTISGSAVGLILVSEVHVADGATITVDGTFTIDGCTVDSDGTFYLSVNAGASFTMARTAFSDGTISVASGSTEIYDNRFDNATVNVTNSSNGARIFHNIVSNLATISDNGVGTVTSLDGWGNVTSDAFTENNLALGLELSPAAIVGQRTIDANGVAYIQPGDQLSATIDVSRLQAPITGVQLLMGYNTDFFTAATLGLASDWDDNIPSTEMDTSNVIGRFNASIGLDFSYAPLLGTDDDQTVGDLGFTVKAGVEGSTQVFHRVKSALDGFHSSPSTPASHLVWNAPPAVGYFTPFTSNTSTIVIDETDPLTNDLLTGATIEQDGQDMTDFITVQGSLEISVAAFDALAGIDDVDAVVTLVGPATYTATQVAVGIGPNIGGNDYTAYDFAYAVTPATLNGVYEVAFVVTDRSGNVTTTVLGDITINKNEITATVELQGLIAGAVTREVTFAFTNAANTVIETRTRSVVFTGGVGTVNFNDVDGATVGVSAKAPTHLRAKAAVVFDGDGQATVAYTGGDRLLGGDISGDNVVNLLDYTMLRNYWLNIVNDVPAAAVANINGDGSVNMTDYNILQSNFHKQGADQ